MGIQNQDFNAILDAKCLSGGSDAERNDFGNKLLSALERDGAVKLVNTTISDYDVKNA